MRRPTLGVLNVLNVRLPTGESTNEKTDSNRLGVDYRNLQLFERLSLMAGTHVLFFWFKEQICSQDAKWPLEAPPNFIKTGKNSR